MNPPSTDLSAVCYAWMTSWASAARERLRLAASKRLLLHVGAEEQARVVGGGIKGITKMAKA